MSLSLYILASGSCGNSAVLRTPAGAALIDAGLGPRTTAARLRGTGISVADLSAICLTHLDRDHFNPNWIDTIIRSGIHVFCHSSRLRELTARFPESDFAVLVHPFDEDSFEPLPGLRVNAIALSHDADGSHGFVFDGFGGRIGYATDLGHVPPDLIERFCDLDVLAIESNYDPQMQLDSARPWFLKQRIMGGRGHLSNKQAFDAVRRILDRCCAAGDRLPAHIVLLHRSRQCNCPAILRALFTGDTRIASRLTLAEQHKRTEWVNAIQQEHHIRITQLNLDWTPIPSLV